MSVRLVAFSTGSRKASVWVRCLGSTSPWKTSLGAFYNGVMTVKLNGVSKKSWKGSGAQQALTSNVAQGDNILEFIFEALESSKDASATIYTRVYFVQVWVDTCLSRKVCLQKLGDGTAEMFALRNDNEQQLQCLQATSPDGICKDWTDCMGSAMKKTLEAVLRVVMAGASARRRKANAQTRRNAAASASLLDQTSVCIDPSTYDPEAAECECFSDIQESCGDKSDEEGCLLDKVCANWKKLNVCSTWKDEMCTASLGSATAIVEDTGSVLIQRSQAEANDTALGNTEDTLKGKCTPSEGS